MGDQIALKWSGSALYLGEFRVHGLGALHSTASSRFRI